MQTNLLEKLQSTSNKVEQFTLIIDAHINVVKNSVQESKIDLDKFSESPLTTVKAIFHDAIPSNEFEKMTQKDKDELIRMVKAAKIMKLFNKNCDLDQLNWCKRLAPLCLFAADNFYSNISANMVRKESPSLKETIDKIKHILNCVDSLNKFPHYTKQQKKEMSILITCFKQSISYKEPPIEWAILENDETRNIFMSFYTSMLNSLITEANFMLENPQFFERFLDDEKLASELKQLVENNKNYIVDIEQKNFSTKVKNFINSFLFAPSKADNTSSNNSEEVRKNYKLPI
jgi:hypothetical protein